jgi:hypothetical protein
MIAESDTRRETACIPTPWSSDEARYDRSAAARGASGRKRNAADATSERESMAAQLEFMQAIQQYKQQSGRMFPTWCEVLEVVQALGYRKEN